MNSRTVTVVVNAPKNDVFSFLSRIENLPKWATEFCQELRKVGGKYKIIPCGPSPSELFFDIKSDKETGVIDMFAGPTEEQMGLFPTRVVELPGGTAYTFTMFQAPGMSDEVFDSQYESLKREFENIKTRFS